MRPHRLRWLALAALYALLAAWSIRQTLPVLPAELGLTVVFPTGRAGVSEPLVTTGVTEAGDFLYVKYVDAATAVLGYDSWASGGPESAPFTFVPGRPYALRLAMPALSRVGPPPKHPRARLRVALDGRELLNHEVSYRGRARTEAWFGENPLGGTTTGHTFRGSLATASGQPLRGVPDVLASWPARLHTWLTEELGTALKLALLAGFIVLVLPAGGKVTSNFLQRPLPEPAYAGEDRPPHRWFLAISALATLVYINVLTGGSWRLVFPESFGSFYDHQAASLLAGHLDVPEAALSSEAFLFEGKYYGYFGPTPALLRLPFVIAGVGFGQLSRCFLVAYFLGCLAAVYALLVLATRHLTRRPSWPSAFATVLLVGSTGLGSTLFFTASRAYIYHEAILCGALFALWSTWFALRYLAEPGKIRWWLAALGTGVLALHARPPAGLFALGLVGWTAAVHLRRSWGAPNRAWLQPLAAGLCAVVGVLSFNALSYLKFKSFEGAPLRYHVQYHPERLAVIGGKNFHLVNWRFNFDSYAWRPNFVLRRSFPWFYSSGADPGDYAGTRIDLAEQTLPVPYAMPALVLLAAIGCAIALLRWPGARLPLAIVSLGALPMALALCTAIAISHRYTADFVPPLVAFAAFGAAALPLLPTGLRHPLAALAVFLAVLALAITLAITLHYQGEIVWGVAEDIRARYLALRQFFDAGLGPVRP